MRITLCSLAIAVLFASKNEVHAQRYRPHPGYRPAPVHGYNGFRPTPPANYRQFPRRNVAVPYRPHPGGIANFNGSFRNNNGRPQATYGGTVAMPHIGVYGKAKTHLNRSGYRNNISGSYYGVRGNRSLHVPFSIKNPGLRYSQGFSVPGFAGAQRTVQLNNRGFSGYQSFGNNHFKAAVGVGGKYGVRGSFNGPSISMQNTKKAFTPQNWSYGGRSVADRIGTVGGLFR